MRALPREHSIHPETLTGSSERRANAENRRFTGSSECFNSQSFFSESCSVRALPREHSIHPETLTGSSECFEHCSKHSLPPASAGQTRRICICYVHTFHGSTLKHLSWILHDNGHNKTEKKGQTVTDTRQTDIIELQATGLQPAWHLPSKEDPNQAG